MLVYWTGSAWSTALFGLGTMAAKTGAATTVDNTVARFDGTAGNIQASSGVYVTDTGAFGIGTGSPYAALDVLSLASGTPTLGNPTYHSQVWRPDGGVFGLGVYCISATGASHLQAQRMDGVATAYDIVLNALGGNVGIGTVSVTERLTVSGNVTISGSIAKGSGTFDIDHPLDPENRNLRHGFVEAPRYELVYRGTAILSAGKALVDIDAASGMSAGTFAALTTNAEVCALHNKNGFARLKASAIEAGKFTITCEDEASADAVTWLVVAERNDAFVKSDLDRNTDADGRFVPEYDKPEYEEAVKP